MMNPVALAIERGELESDNTGQLFPVYDNKRLRWDIEEYLTVHEEEKNFPRMRVVIRMMILVRPDKLAQQKRDFCNTYGRVQYMAQKCLSIIKQEEQRAGQPECVVTAPPWDQAEFA